MSLPNPRTAGRRDGFTLIELLVVISIIIVLMGLLLPAISRIRQQAHATDTRALVQSLGAVIQAYQGDFNAYPGPVPNSQLRVAGLPTATPPGSGIGFTKGSDVANMSMAENLYVGLLGGLGPNPSGTNPPFIFDATKAGNGPRWLGPTPKKLPPYMDNVDIRLDVGGQGFFKDDDETAAKDTEIPEFVDRFPGAMPLLYLRARVGAPGVASADSKPAGDPDQQYDLAQVLSYTDSDIGPGKQLDQGSVKGHKAPDPWKPFHGLKTVNPDATIAPVPDPKPAGYAPQNGVQFYPYDLYAALINPSVQRREATPTMPANTPRQKDAYILISAGIDRIYGTEDDITNFGSY